MKRILLQFMICSAFSGRSDIKIHITYPHIFSKMELSPKQIEEAKALIYILNRKAHQSQINKIKLRLQKLHVMDSKGKIIIDFDKHQKL